MKHLAQRRDREIGRGDQRDCEKRPGGNDKLADMRPSQLPIPIYAPEHERRQQTVKKQRIFRHRHTPRNAVNQPGKTALPQCILSEDG